MNDNNINSILFVCMGNICRSPSAEAIFRTKAQKLMAHLTVDSAGTIAAHVGETPDKRSQQTARARGYSFDGITARQVNSDDFEQFDLILAMDLDNLHNLQLLSSEKYQHKIKLFLDFAEHFSEQEVPDPYYGGSQGFEHVVDLIEDASDGLLKHLTQGDKQH